jgi:nucleotide-binding universal stress UspA family protein
MSSQDDETAPGIAFKAVACGIDASPESLEAASQAIQIATEDARLWAVSVWDPGLAMHAGIHASEVARELREESSTALEHAQAELPQLEPVLLRGSHVAGLLAAIANLEADLVAVGAHGVSRPAGIVFGSVATAMAHHAPCSVLIARPSPSGSFPGPIVHATDGSDEAVEAGRIAGRLAARHGVEILTLSVADDVERGAAVAGEGATAVAEGGAEPQTRVERGSPHRGVVAVASEVGASLIVIGSRGLTGVQALGSVSERVAHHAPCSVLVVRRPTHPSTEPP